MEIVIEKGIFLRNNIKNCRQAMIRDKYLFLKIENEQRLKEN